MRPCKSGQQSDKRRESFFPWVVIVALATVLQAGCASAPERFIPAHPLEPAQVAYGDLESALQGAVQDGVVNYSALQADRRFADYLGQLDRVDPDSHATDTEQLAFWINAYNAFAIQGILDGYRPRPYVGWYRYFKGREYAVGGRKLTLSEIEHEILRTRFHEPRIHFAIVCASASCPKLPSWVFRADQLERQLDQVARAFINDPSRNQFDTARKVAHLSQIFDWFEADFATAAGDVLTYVGRYVADPDVARDLRAHQYRIEYLSYDWSLNGIPPHEVPHAGAS